MMKINRIDKERERERGIGSPLPWPIYLFMIRSPPRCFFIFLFLLKKMSDIRLSNDGPRWIERIKQIFSRSDEQQPLLGKPKKSKKWIISVISLAAALSLLGVTIGYWVHHHDTVNGKKEKKIRQ